MFDKSISGNKLRGFDFIQQIKLGRYVYALRDPRDGKVFYVGQGVGNRIFDHFNEADDWLRNGEDYCLQKNKFASSKIIRILDIWRGDEDVNWFIVAHNIVECDLDGIVSRIESAVIDALSMSQNGVCLNEIKAPKSSLLIQDDVGALAAEPVNPTEKISRVFVFPIQNSINEQPIYDATRQAWSVKDSYRDTSETTYAVGINKGISIGSYIVDRWFPVGNKYGFDGRDYEPLLNKNWTAILSKVIGYWQRGNYLIVEFDGKGACRIERGCSDHNWFDFENKFSEYLDINSFEKQSNSDEPEICGIQEETVLNEFDDSEEIPMPLGCSKEEFTPELIDELRTMKRNNPSLYNKIMRGD